jgi:hypothetical protein
MNSGAHAIVVLDQAAKHGTKTLSSRAILAAVTAARTRTQWPGKIGGSSREKTALPTGLEILTTSPINADYASNARIKPVLENHSVAGCIAY